MASSPMSSSVSRKTTTSSGLSEDELNAFVQSIIAERQEMEPFYVLDVGVVMELFHTWTRNLPMVQPFYAVKCNPSSGLLALMAALGFSFDCASRAEIEAILALGVSPARVVFANPCKAESHIRYAASVGVNLTTFDSKEEVEKLRKWHPKTALLIRIKAPETSGAKYGALPEEVVPLLQAAQAAGLTVAGVAFHIGSDALHFRAFEEAIAEAKAVFEQALQLGMPKMHILDVGGGFSDGPRFMKAASAIKTALQKHFPNELDELQVIAEPGRLFAEPSFSLATTIIGKRVRNEGLEYWINDGIYGGMNFLLQEEDHQLRVTPLAATSNPHNPTAKGLETYNNSTIFGPTCDSRDIVLKGHSLPEMEINDWLVFHRMGAYTWARGSKFNGFDTSTIPTYLTNSHI